MAVGKTSNVLTSVINHGSVIPGSRRYYLGLEEQWMYLKIEVKKIKREEASEVIWATVRKVEYEMGEAEGQNHMRGLPWWRSG